MKKICKGSRKALYILFFFVYNKNDIKCDKDVIPLTKARSNQKQPQKAAPKKKTARKLSAGERRGMQTLFAILFVAGIMYLFAMIIIALFVWYSFSTPAESETLYALQIVEEDSGAKKVSYSVAQANNSYGLYLRYSDIAPLCGFGIAGDEEQVTMYLPAEGMVGNDKREYVTLNRNSSLIYVNGNSVRLPAPVLFEGEDYLLPVSLFEGYVYGLDVTYDEEEKLCVVTIPEKLSFTLKMHKPEEAEQCDLTLLPQTDVSDEMSAE